MPSYVRWSSPENMDFEGGSNTSEAELGSQGEVVVANPPVQEAGGEVVGSVVASQLQASQRAALF